MKNKYILFSFLLVVTTFGATAAKPFGGCWHPDDIRDWKADNYPLLKFNRSRTPLKPRAPRTEKMRINENQRENGGITNATILYPRCSAAPSQGDYTFTGYQPTYWQYVDKLVYWAGSASEGIIIPPPAPTIDAAHAEGVKVLGQVFFPPTYFGGKREWVVQMLTQENGHYPYAVKLFEIARDLGFDGWFINEETGGGSNDSWVGFFNEFYATAKAEGFDGMELQWYNASRYPNIPILTTDSNTSQFIEYGLISDYRNQTKDLGCSEEQTFEKIYAGIECSKAGLTGYGSYLNQAFPRGEEHKASVALFCQEERTWKDYVRNILGKEDTGEAAYDAVAKVFEAEQLQWVNRAGDPSVDDKNWRGISGAIQERSAVTSLPFSSDMSVGVGKHRFVRGEKRGSRDWHHSGVQSVLPTWRWLIENRGDLKVIIDWDDAYNIGSSYKIVGTLAEGNHNIPLYRTSITLPDAVTVKIVYKGEAPRLIVSADGDLLPDADFDGAAPEVSDCGNGWQQALWSLSSLAGRHLDMIGINLFASKQIDNYSFSLGRVAIQAEDMKNKSVNLRNLKVEGDKDQERAEALLTWDFDPSDSFDRFDIYMTYGSERSLVGQTRGEGFYIPPFKRVAESDIAEFEIIPVYRDMTEESAEKTILSFPTLEKPSISFKLSRSYVKVDEEFVLTARATNFPNSIEWNLPSELEKVGNDNDFTIRLKPLSEGEYVVKAVVTNRVGETTIEKTVVNVLSDADYDSVGNILVGKKIHSFSGSTNAKEIPDNLIDGVVKPSSLSSKWCSLDSNNWVIFDCGSIERFYGFKIYDCKSGPEDAENFHSYTVEISSDLKDWQLVVDEKEVEGLDIKEEYVVPTDGRYIRFSPKVDGVLRVWEFEAIAKGTLNGIPSTNNASLERIIGIYSVDGRRLEHLGQGINIVIYSGGRTEKIVN